MILQHEFINYDNKQLLDEFCNRINIFQDKFYERLINLINSYDIKTKGTLFEIFIEYIMRSNKFYKYRNYRINKSNNDFGIDGFCEYNDFKFYYPIQIKFRNNTKITFEELTKCFYNFDKTNEYKTNIQYIINNTKNNYLLADEIINEAKKLIIITNTFDTFDDIIKISYNNKMLKNILFKDIILINGINLTRVFNTNIDSKDFSESIKETLLYINNNFFI